MFSYFLNRSYNLIHEKYLEKINCSDFLEKNNKYCEAENSLQNDILLYYVSSKINFIFKINKKIFEIFRGLVEYL